MANLSRDKPNLKKVDVKFKAKLELKLKPKPKLKPNLKSFDMSHINVNFFDVLKAMHHGKVKTVLDTSTGEPVIITSKMYQQLLKAA